MDARARWYLRAMGIPVWRDRDAALPDIRDAEPEELPARSPAGGTDAAWRALEEAVRSCRRCDLHRGRTQAVFGTGDREARLMIIGEAPGREEDLRGEPFVGRAGQLLNEMLRAIGLSREQVFIANVLKSRPPGNRDPRPEEVAACEPFLREQLALIRPRAILALGRFAAHHLLASEERIGALRGRAHDCGGTPLVVTYHPAYLLRSPAEKRRAWEDLCLVSRILADAQ